MMRIRLGAKWTYRWLQRDRGQDPVGASAGEVSCGCTLKPIGLEHTPVIGLIAIAKSARWIPVSEVLLELVVEGGVVLLVGVVEACRNRSRRASAVGAWDCLVAL
jgi:hypothetical protein